MTRTRHSSRFAPAMLAMAGVCLLAACGRPEAPPSAAVAPAGPSYPRSADGLATVVGQAPPGAVVSLEPVAGVPLPPSAPAVMDQRGKQFLPGFLMIQTGQGVQFLNSEDIPHNIFVVQRRVGRTILDASTDPGQSYTHVFDRAGEFDVSCNIHPGMEAAIIVTAAPLAAVADAKGRFAILNAAPGDYDVVVSDAGSPTTRRIAVTAPLTEIGAPGR